VVKLGCYFPYSLITFDVPRNMITWCCKQETGNLLSSFNPKEYFSDPVLTDIRSSLNNGIEHTLCSSCWKTEKSGIQSWRQTNGSIPDHLKNINLDTMPYNKIVKRLEIKLDNTCDLACIYCGPWDSTTWQRENNKSKFHNYTIDVIDDSLQQKIIDTVLEIGKSNNELEIGFVGGESFLSKHIKQAAFKRYIDAFYTHASVSSLLTLKFVSNANTPDKILNQTIKILEQSKLQYPGLQINVALSFESTGEFTEASRYLSSWEQIDKNVNKWLARDWVNVTINTAFNALTLSDLPNFVDYIIKVHKLYNRKISITSDIVYYPQGLTPSVLPDTFATYIDAALIKISEDMFTNDVDAGYEKFIDAMNNIKRTLGTTTEQHKSSLKRYLTYCIEVRKIDIQKISPNLHNFVFSS
jgi:sulfatase maturation enzyme AslB (radical SAM superfamily)